MQTLPGTTPLSRAAFPITHKWKYCNHAAVGPLPVLTREAIVRVLDAQSEDGCAGILDVESNLEAIRGETASTMGATVDEVAFMRSTSDGALVVANGLRWREGDEIILGGNEFGANAYPWLNLRDLGVRVRMVRTPQHRLTVETLDALCTKRTRLVAVSYVTFLDGYRHDLQALGSYCREHGILFAVDAMQGFGYLPLDVRSWKIDFCYFGVAKWLLSPQGLSVVFAREDLINSLRPATCSWRSVEQPMTFLDYGQPLARGARRFEGGTINYPALIGFRESLRLLSTSGFDNIERHVLSLNEYLLREAKRRSIDILSETRSGTRSGIVLLGLGNRDVEALNEKAARAHVSVTIRDSGVRVSPHGYNTQADIDAVLELFSG